MALYYALSPLLPPMARQGEVALATHFTCQPLLLRFADADGVYNAISP